jgi:NADH-quinone oxidoreductase subunit C
MATAAEPSLKNAPPAAVEASPPGEGETQEAPPVPAVPAEGESGKRLFSETVAACAGVPVSVTFGQEVLFPSGDAYVEVVTALRDAGFETCADLCAVDYLLHPGRAVPDGVTRERFEVVVNLLSLRHRLRIRVRVQVAEAEPSVPTLFHLYPGTENMEREAFDMFGILFEGHPDMSRILMPEDWEGHPLRKDYAVGRVPVQFKEAPGPR